MGASVEGDSWLKTQNTGATDANTHRRPWGRKDLKSTEKPWNSQDYPKKAKITFQLPGRREPPKRGRRKKQVRKREKYTFFSSEQCQPSQEIFLKMLFVFVILPPLGTGLLALGPQMFPKLAHSHWPSNAIPPPDLFYPNLKDYALWIPIIVPQIKEGSSVPQRCLFQAELIPRNCWWYCPLSISLGCLQQQMRKPWPTLFRQKGDQVIGLLIQLWIQRWGIPDTVH